MNDLIAFMATRSLQRLRDDVDPRAGRHRDPPAPTRPRRRHDLFHRSVRKAAALPR